MIRVLLLLLMSGVMAYGQDTLAVVDPKYGGDAEIFFVGDTILLRMPYDKSKTATRGSEAWLFYGNQKLANLDLKAIGSDPVLGLKKYNDTTYYYSVGGGKKELKTIIYRSIGIGR